ncbi:large-conductance mechanosensitive channel protein MscL [Marinifilum flexuosum]|uniref:Large-conductance mechanosensitive channel n=1 Tax=Marinifilum flexuosum TaxID=1117708 RepID=A0A419X777_9BACT|nr:large-conductance mechanosensitive channel protein MscL [Marinifilum flexuosum]RKE03624.1 large conductance mechanosensitive channel [Marinifilum flexuosum]
MKILKEFKEFAIKGNMFDMAIGIIIGVAFNKIVSSLVNDVLLPAFSMVIGKVNFQTLSIVLQEKQLDANGQIIQELVELKYGNFIQVTLDFFIIALVIFAVVKVINNIRRKGEDVKNETVATPKDIELLTEIRDLLKQRNEK